MVATLLARRAAASAPAVARQQMLAPKGVRAIHIENTVETSLPFRQGKARKIPIAIGVTTFLVGGFSLPFFAAWFQLKKSAT